MPAFDDLLPEELEARNRELTVLLEQIYQQPALVEGTISKAEQERILVEVRASLLATDPVVEKREAGSPLLVVLPNKKLADSAQPPFKEKDEKHPFMNKEIHASRFMQKKQLLHQHFQRLVEASIVAVLIASLLLGWFALIHTRSTQGEPTPLFTYTSQPGENLYDLKWTPDEHYLTFMACKTFSNCRFLVWNVATGKVKQTSVAGFLGSTSASGYGGGSLDSPDGQYSLLFTSDRGKNTGVLQLENILTGQVKQICRGEVDPNPQTAVFSHDGTSVAFVGDRGFISVWNIAAGKITLTIRASGIQQISWSADDKRINGEGTAGFQVWDAQTGRLLASIVATPTMELPYTATTAGLSPDEQRMLAYNPQTGTFAVRDTSTLKVLQTLQTQVYLPANSTITVAWLANGTRLLLGYNHQGSLWNSATGQRLASFSFVDVSMDASPVSGNVNNPVTSANAGEARYIACLPYRSNQWVIWDALTGTRVRTLPPTTDLSGSFWLLGDKYLVVINSNLSHGQIYNALTGQPVASYQGLTLGLVALSKDGRYLAVASNPPPVKGESVNTSKNTVQVFAAP